MYFDTKPCQVCGSEVELHARETGPDDGGGGRVGPTDGVVGDADSTIDARVCTNRDCPTHQDSDREP